MMKKTTKNYQLPIIDNLMIFILIQHLILKVNLYSEFIETIKPENHQKL